MLVAITGKAGAGKDTAASALVKTLKFSTLSFAGPLKESCKHKFNLSDDDVYTQEGKKRFVPKIGLTVGQILQKEGTEATRGFWGQDFWVRRWEDDYAACLERGITDIVITDCRFDNEAAAICAAGGKIIRVTRPDAEPEAGRDPNHPSERGIDNKYLSAIIVNDRGIKDLKNKTLEIVRGWGVGHD